MDSTQWLTASLVVITGYYAWQSRRTVNEMREQGRRLQQPRLRLSIDVIGHNHIVVSVNNAGTGAAFDLDLVLTFEHEPGVARKTDIREWRANLLLAGEKVSFHFPRAGEENDLPLERIADLYSRVNLTGQVDDSLGVRHTVADSLSNLREFAVMYKQGGHHVESPDSVTIANAIRSINRALSDASKMFTGVGLSHLTCSDCGSALAEVIGVKGGNVEFAFHGACAGPAVRSSHSLPGAPT